MENKYELFMGRLGKQPELRYTKKGEPVCSLAVEVNNNTNDRADWKQVIVWGKQAEHCNLYLKKGYEVFVQGRNQNRQFRDREGQLRTITECNARLIGFPNI